MTAPRTPRLYVFSGLPGVGKTTLARGLATELGAVLVRIDAIEQALRDAGVVVSRDEGYRAGYAVAAENLALGLPVVADSVNPIAVTREAWQRVAADAGVECVDIEVVCSDEAEHRRRVETRESDIPGLLLPTWPEVLAREYEPWRPDVTIDTAGRTVEASLRELLDLLSG